MRQTTFDKTIELGKERDAKLVLEIGGIRNPDGQVGDGHSTIIWCDNFERVISVDIDENATKLTKELTNNRAEAITSDAIEFIKNFHEKIDILYLDAWDVGTENFAENHLEFFKLAEKNLHDKSLVLIDDVALNDMGKGKLVIPYMQSKGWKPVLIHYQGLFSK